MRTKSPKGKLHRHLAPDGTVGPWRKSPGIALRDAVYVLKGWGKRDGSGVTVKIDIRIACTFIGELKAAGWRFQEVPQ